MFEAFDIWYDDHLGSEDGCAACRVDDGVIHSRGSQKNLRVYSRANTSS